MKRMLRLENIVVKNVLEIDSLMLEEDVISIEGQSGSGKSTVLRLLNNLDTPTSGTIYFHNKDIMEIDSLQLRKQIVMLPQSSVLFDGTIRDNLLIGLTYSGQEKIADNELEKVLHDLWVNKKLGTSVHDLSGGEQQRMALARILLLKEAKVYLLDEPSSDLDHQTTDHVLKTFVSQAKARNQQIIMVTHDTSVSKKFADTIINMDKYSKQIKNGDES